MAIDETRKFTPINIAILTVSDTRTPETDTSGDILAARVEQAGHTLAARTIVKDDAEVLARQFDAWIDDAQIDAVVSTGGTGLTGRDVTPEALARIEGGRDIPGFGEDRKLLNARIAWIHDRWTVGLWGKNLLDNEVTGGISDISTSSFGTPFVSIDPPRTYGIEVGYRF